MYKKVPRQIDLDTQDNQTCLVTKVPAWFIVTAFGTKTKVNVGDPGRWAFYKDQTTKGESILQVVRVS